MCMAHGSGTTNAGEPTPGLRKCWWRLARSSTASARRGAGCRETMSGGAARGCLHAGYPSAAGCTSCRMDYRGRLPKLQALEAANGIARRWRRAEQLHGQRGQRFSRASWLAAVGVRHPPPAACTLPAAVLCGSSSARPMGPPAVWPAQAVRPPTGLRPTAGACSPPNPRPWVAPSAVQPAAAAAVHCREHCCAAPRPCPPGLPYGWPGAVRAVRPPTQYAWRMYATRTGAAPGAASPALPRRI